MTAQMRALLGFVAAVLSVLTFHQGMWALLYALGMMPRGPYPMTPVRPSGCRSSPASASGAASTVSSSGWCCRAFRGHRCGC